MRLRVGVADDGPRAAGYPDDVVWVPLPGEVHLLVARSDGAADAVAGSSARVVLLLRATDRADGADGADGAPDDAAADEARDLPAGLRAEVVLAGVPRGAPGAAPASPRAVAERVVGALVSGADLAAALATALSDVVVLAGDADLLGRLDLGALVGRPGGRDDAPDEDQAAGGEPLDDFSVGLPCPPLPPPRVEPLPPPPPDLAEPCPAAPPPGEGEEDPRYLQCRVAAESRPGAPVLPPNAVGVGHNTVTVFVGPAEAAALGVRVTNAQLGFRPGVDQVRLTAVLVPLEPRGAPTRATLRVPRVGRSTDARLGLDVPPGTRRVSARLLLLHRNRVVQTAVLSGVVGRPATLAELALVRPTLAGLRDRRRFDATVVANHDAAQQPALVGHRDGRTASVPVPVLEEIEPTVARLRALLVDAAFQRGRAGATTWPRPEVELLVRLAIEGRDLHAFLESYLLPFGADLRRLQVVTARSGMFLPLELAYARPAPDDDAVLCPSWAAGGEACGPACGAGPDDTTIVCPAAFLGLRATIERHHVDDVGAGGPQYLTTAAPLAGRRRLTARRALLAASSKVSAADVGRVRAAFDPAAGCAVTWAEWTTALAADDTDVLVLLPHTDVAHATLEISRTTLPRGRIETRYVTGGRDVRPVVLLLGCDTAGCGDDPAGFATRFLARDAAVVVSSLTMLRAGHAAALAERLARTLLAAAADRRRTPVGDLVTAFRRDAVAEGLLAALAVTAYGDADWTL